MVMNRGDCRWRTIDAVMKKKSVLQYCVNNMIFRGGNLMEKYYVN